MPHYKGKLAQDKAEADAWKSLIACLLRTPNKTHLSTSRFSPRRWASLLPERGFSPASAGFC
jgi:hypothetical protein